MKKLLSESVIKKLLAIFGDGFKSAINGIIIFILTYGLIFYFLYVMLIIASTYLVTMIKMVFVLSLGPIFIIFALFSKTNDMFKQWVAFLGSRALEMALLFLILSPFLITIDRFFTDLFYYKVCGVQKGIPPVYLYVLQTIDLNRSLFEWIVKLLKIAGVIFIMHQVIGKVSEIAGYLISISGIPNQDITTKAGYGTGGFQLASGAVGAALGLGVSGLKGLGSIGARGAGSAIGGATSVARATGIASAWNAIGKKIPFRGLRTRARDAVINGAIKEAKANGKSMGLSGKELDQYVRDETMKTLAKRLTQEPTKMALYGVDSTSISKVLDQNLIRDGMKEFITKKAQELK
jgi:type IV secretory pathway VirB6-like protein